MLKEQYQKQIEGKVSQFRKHVDKISASDHPKYNVEGQREYEIEQLKTELDNEVAILDAEFNAKIDEQIEAQERVAARSNFYITPADKVQVDNYISDLTSALTFAMNDADKAEAFSVFESKLDMLDSEGALAEVKRRLPELAKYVKDDSYSMTKLRGFFHTFSALKTPEQELLDDLKSAKLNGVSYKYRTLKMTHKAYSSQQSARVTNKY
ncbi:hypothetical protein M3172_04900 [Mesobacillus subterraneus]|uniref:hypothetical protein n=1 Tax=Mesobacillus subterraneus TaxID=285983 RepID=UPI00203B5FBE|nr:hypothetical protein [Mesobacillus subterraneus]MCM3572517.1 hypothetical protein [Mesobacillus subterraneus]